MSQTGRTSRTSRTSKRKGIRMRTPPRGRRPVRTGRTAQRVLIAEGVALGAAALALLVHEFPGIVREVRIWRMINIRSGAKRPR